jgi:hypothetical protein
VEVTTNLPSLVRHIQLPSVRRQHSNGWDVHGDAFSTQNPWKEQAIYRSVRFRPCFLMFCWPITELRYEPKSRRFWIRSYQWADGTGGQSDLPCCRLVASAVVLVSLLVCHPLSIPIPPNKHHLVPNQKLVHLRFVFCGNTWSSLALRTFCHSLVRSARSWAARRTQIPTKALGVMVQKIAKLLPAKGVLFYFQLRCRSDLMR